MFPETIGGSVYFLFIYCHFSPFCTPQKVVKLNGLMFYFFINNVHLFPCVFCKCQPHI